MGAQPSSDAPAPVMSHENLLNITASAYLQIHQNVQQSVTLRQVATLNCDPQHKLACDTCVTGLKKIVDTKYNITTNDDIEATDRLIGDACAPVCLCRANINMSQTSNINFSTVMAPCNDPSGTSCPDPTKQSADQMADLIEQSLTPDAGADACPMLCRFQNALYSNLAVSAHNLKSAMVPQTAKLNTIWKETRDVYDTVVDREFQDSLQAALVFQNIDVSGGAYNVQIDMTQTVKIVSNVMQNYSELTSPLDQLESRMLLETSKMVEAGSDTAERNSIRMGALIVVVTFTLFVIGLILACGVNRSRTVTIIEERAPAPQASENSTSHPQRPN